MTDWLLGTLALAYLIIQIRRTRDELYIVMLAWSLGAILLAVLTRISWDRNLLSGVPWETLRTLYFIIGVAIGLFYLSRVVWPYPIVKASQLYAKAVEFYEQGDMRQASRVIRQLIAVSPRRADARYWLGRILNEQGKYREAVRHLKFAQELNPEFVGTLLELGFAFKMLKNYQDAVNAFEQALALEPDNAYAAEQLEICQRKLQDISTVS